jgi:DNA-binding GntR family transcriptional regulator
MSRPDTAARYAYKTIKAQILQGKFAPGERLAASKLEKLLGVSHIPIREALQLLWAEGLVVYSPHKMPMVADNTKETRDEMLLVRALLEVPAMGVAATMLSPEGLKTMRRLQREMKEAHLAGDITKYIAANDQFHRTLYAAVGIGQLEKIIVTLQEATSSHRHRLLTDKKKRALAIADHDRLLAALERKDVEEVRAISFAHLVQWDEFGATGWIESLSPAWAAAIERLSITIRRRHGSQKAHDSLPRAR